MTTPNSDHGGGATDTNPSRVFELLALRAAGVIEADEGAELDRLALASPHEFQKAQRALAALELGLSLDESTEAIEQPSPMLREKLSQNAESYFSAPQGSRGNDGGGSRVQSVAGVSNRVQSGLRISDYFRATLPWLAAAATVVMAFMLMRGNSTPTPLQPAAVVAKLDQTPDVVRLAFKAGVSELAAAKAEVVWSDTLQQGYLRISGVKPNDPTRSQFQLWIVDPSRDARPVDGGVFDIAASGEVIIPVTSRLPVHQPAAFAITAEKPGGVVVSGGPMLLVASKS
jgi:anti-sigma-K factor RskA